LGCGTGLVPRQPLQLLPQLQVWCLVERWRVPAAAMPLLVLGGGAAVAGSVLPLPRGCRARSCAHFTRTAMLSLWRAPASVRTVISRRCRGG
jgi:hypothetical protein